MCVDSPAATDGRWAVSIALTVCWYVLRLPLMLAVMFAECTGSGLTGRAGRGRWIMQKRNRARGIFTSVMGPD